MEFWKLLGSVMFLQQTLITYLPMETSIHNCRRFHRWLAAVGSLIHRQLTATGAFQLLIMCQQQFSNITSHTRRKVQLLSIFIYCLLYNSTQHQQETPPYYSIRHKNAKTLTIKTITQVQTAFIKQTQQSTQISFTSRSLP